VNVQIRRVTALALVMILALFASATYTQFVKASALRQDPRNARTYYQSFNRDRGPIIVAGKAVASSKRVKDDFGYQRRYSKGPLYAPATGFFSVVFGMTGIEAAYDEVLQGTADSLFLSRIQDLVTGRQRHGGGVELTLDPDVQTTAWDALGDQRGAVIVLNATTGEILAMVSKPSFDPADLAGHDTAEVNKIYQKLLKNKHNPLWNRAISGNLYSPGSTFKLITAAAALESGDYTSESVLPAPVTLRLPGTEVDLGNMGDSQCSSVGEMTMIQALAISCNTAFANLGMELGEDALREQAAKFGFSQALSIPTYVTPSTLGEDMDEPQVAMSAIGQFDDRVTPLQMAMVAAAAVNEGVIMAPHLVRTLRNSDLSVVKTIDPVPFATAISPSTARQLRAMMVQVVTSGSGSRAAIPGVEVGGKTGTAEKTKGQPPDNWFVSFADDGDTRLAVAVVVEDGGKAGMSGTGGAVAAPIARAVMEAAMAK